MVTRLLLQPYCLSFPLATCQNSGLLIITTAALISPWILPEAVTQPVTVHDSHRVMKLLFQCGWPSVCATFWQLDGSSDTTCFRKLEALKIPSDNSLSSYLERVLEGLQLRHHAVPHHICQLREHITKYAASLEQTA